MPSSGNTCEMSFLKNIKLLPTGWCFDLWVADDQEKCISEAMERYGLARHIAEGLFDTKNFVAFVECGENAKIKHSLRMMMCIEKDCKNAVIAHESYHLLHYLAKRANLEVTFEAQEWGACMIDYIFTQVEKNIRK